MKKKGSDMSIKDYDCVKGIPKILVWSTRSLILKNLKRRPVSTTIKLLIALPFYYVYKLLYLVTLPFAIPNEFLRRIGGKDGYK